MTPMRSATAGFTLLELLAALAVMGLLLVLLSQGVQFGLRTTQAQAAFQTRHADLDAVDRTLRRLVAQAHPGTYPEPASLRGTASGMTLTTTLPGAVLGAATLADVALGTESGRLMMRWTPRLHAERFGTPPPPQATVIVDGVDRVEFAYGNGGAWQPSWRADRLPQLVRIRIVFPDRSGRRWPPIVAAPATEPIEQ